VDPDDEPRMVNPHPEGVPENAARDRDPTGGLSPGARTRRTALIAAIVLAVVTGCEEPPASDGIPVGLLLSYTGSLAANSANSERALLMALDAANQSGGVDRKRLRLVARDTRSDPRKVSVPAGELLDAGAAILIGPDFSDFLTQLRPLLRERTILLPSVATASDIEYKPASWFVMGPSLVRLACHLLGQAAADGRHNPIQIVGPSSYNGSLSYVLSNRYNLPKHVLSTNQASSPTVVRPLTRALVEADAYILAAPTTTASSLVYALTAIGALGDPTRWYLSPTLHSPAFLEAIPKGSLDGARGVSSGTVAGAAEFRAQFLERWHEEPLDDAYPFYDAGAIAVLAIQRALRDEGTIPTGTGLSRHLVAVTQAGAMSVRWNEIGRGLELLRAGAEVGYFGLTGELQFDDVGKTTTVSARSWTIENTGFVDRPHSTNCDSVR
jgi:ABC-type branched-subunit amino acid transport system substrate-binding protein